MMKAYVFAHNDLDGVGVQIICRAYCKKYNYEPVVFPCTYSNINDRVMDMIKNANPREITIVFIGDISVNRETAEALDNWRKENHKLVVLRDHHETAEHLNQYPWAKVNEVDFNGIKRCGTYWMWQWMMNLPDREAVSYFDHYNLFTFMVDSYDTWKWKDDEFGIHANRLNSLYSLMGEEAFTDYIFDVCKVSPEKPEELFTEKALMLVETDEAMARKTSQRCEKNMWVSEMLFAHSHSARRIKYTVGIVFCSDYVSAVSDYCLTQHPELDILMAVNFPKTISLRTQKDLSMPLGEIAKQITGQGGGHPHAAGCTIDGNDFQHGFLELMVNLADGASINCLYPAADKYSMKEHYTSSSYKQRGYHGKGTWEPSEHNNPNKTHKRYNKNYKGGKR